MVCNLNQNKIKGKTSNIVSLKSLVSLPPLPPLPSSQIITDRQLKQVLSWVNENKNLKFKYNVHLLYRASQHGFEAKPFHKYCDNKDQQ